MRGTYQSPLPEVHHPAHVETYRGVTHLRQSYEVDVLLLVWSVVEQTVLLLDILGEVGHDPLRPSRLACPLVGCVVAAEFKSTLIIHQIPLLTKRATFLS